MKYKIYIFITILLLISSTTYSQNLAYANLDKIIKSSNAGEKIIKHYSKLKKDIVEDFKKKEQIIRDKELKLISQKNILEKNEYTKKINSLNEEIKNLNLTTNNSIKKLNEASEKTTKEFLDNINILLKQFAEKKNIDIIFSSNQILIGKSNIDVTEQILILVNENIKNFEIKK